MGIIRRFFWVAVLVSVVVVSLGPLPAASAGPARATSAVRLTLHLVGSGERLLVHAPYVFIARAGGGTLIDERMGIQKRVSRPGCDAQAIGGRWLEFSCAGDSDPELYRLATGQWRRVVMGPSIAKQCVASDGCGVGFAGVGADWLQFLIIPCFDHCDQFSRFQNIYTGEVRSDPTSPTTIPNLNSAELTQKVCSPVHVPYGSGGPDGPAEVPGSLTFEGKYVIASSEDYTKGYRVFLERCGSRSRRLLCRNTTTAQCDLLTANKNLAIWPTGRNQTLIGESLASSKRIQITSSQYVQDIYELALTSRTLYLMNQQDQVFVAQAPRPGQSPGALPQ